MIAKQFVEKVNQKTTLKIENSQTTINGSPRKRGPESDLVMDFLSKQINNSPEDYHQAILIEPSLGNLIPDIVILLWNPVIFRSWEGQLSSLDTFDYKLLQLFYISGPLSFREINKLSKRATTSNLDKLETANLLVRYNDKWTINDPSQIFAIKSITTIEAKISAVEKAISQAFINTWFSSESYILTGNESHHNTTISRATNRGIGIFGKTRKFGYKKILKAREIPIPNSYWAWFFNEFLWINFKMGNYVSESRKSHF